MSQFQWPCLRNSHIRYCLQFSQLGGFVPRELNAFGRLRQALVHIQTTNNALGRRPRSSSRHTRPNRPVRVMEVSIWAGMGDIKEFGLKHKVSPGACHCSGPQTFARFGAKTNGEGCASHPEHENTRNLQEARISQWRTRSYLAGKPFRDWSNLNSAL